LPLAIAGFAASLGVAVDIEAAVITAGPIRVLGKGVLR
jgi:hypothetical protein